MKFTPVVAAIALSLLAFGQASALPLGSASPWIYYADNDLRTINRIRLDGSAPEVLVNTAPVLLGLAVDAKAGKIYWSNGGSGGTVGGAISRANLDGSASEVVYAATPGAQEAVNRMALDKVNSQLYWTDPIGGKIRTMPTSGGIPTAVASVSQLSTALEVDPKRGHLYFSSGINGFPSAFIERINFDGSGRTPVVQADAYSINLDLKNEKIYLADWSGNRIRRAGFDGVGLTNVVSPVLVPRDVQVAGDSIYFANIYSQAANGTGPYFFQWVKAALDGSNREVLWEAPRLEGPRDAISFAVVIPEPATTWLAGMGMGVMVAIRKRCRRRCRDRLTSHC